MSKILSEHDDDPAPDRSNRSVPMAVVVVVVVVIVVFVFVMLHLTGVVGASSH
jgi:hypothetical protein